MQNSRQMMAIHVLDSHNGSFMNSCGASDSTATLAKSVADVLRYHWNPLTTELGRSTKWELYR